MRDNKVNVLKKMLGMILVAPLVLSLSLFAADPIHHWDLDETAGSTYEDTGTIGDANGTCTSPDGCPSPSEGQIYGAQNFDGNDTIEIANTADFDWAADANVTIEFWMKSDANVSFNNNDMMIGRSTDAGNTILWYIAIAPGGLIRAGINDGVFQGVTGTTVINDGKWNHIAYVLNPGQVRVFVNGEYDFNITRGAAADLTSDTNVTIGNINYNVLPDNWRYTGDLDDIKLYATDLNGSTIKEHYENGFKPHLEVVTPVPTPTTDTTPDFTFSSDKAGIITYGGACKCTKTDAIVGNNLITFNTLAIGIYNNCTITVTAADGNVSDPLAVPTFEVTAEPDVTAPTLAEVTAVPTPTDDNTPDYTFSSDEAGMITYGGSCTSATTAAIVGDNTITFDALADEVYGDCMITVTDEANNSSTPLDVSEFVVDTTVPGTSVITGSGGGCTYNPDSKNLDMMFLLMIALGLFYPFRRRFIK